MATTTSSSSSGSSIVPIPTKEGWLEKRGDWGFRWAKRFFRLTADGLLRNYTSESVTEKPKGSFQVPQWNFTKIDIKGKFCIIMRSPGQKDVTIAAARQQDRDAWFETLRTFAMGRALFHVRSLQWYEVAFPKVVLDTQFKANDQDERGSVVVTSVLSAGEGETLGLAPGDVVIEVGHDFVAHLPYDKTIARIRASDARPLRMVLGRPQGQDIPEGAEPVSVPDDMDIAALLLARNNAAAAAAAAAQGEQGATAGGSAAAVGGGGGGKDENLQVNADLTIAKKPSSAGGPEEDSTATEGGQSGTPTKSAQEDTNETKDDDDDDDDDGGNSAVAGESGSPSAASAAAGVSTTTTTTTGEDHDEIEVPGAGINITTESHNRWVEQQNSEQYVPVLADPTEEKEGGISMQKFTAYRLTTTRGEKFWSVWRRFSDFVWLRDTLKERYIGLCIPPLPLSEHRNVNTLFKKLGKPDDAFIEVRMLGLAAFMRTVLTNTFLKNDTSVQQFLTTQDRKKFEKIKLKQKQASLAKSGGIFGGAGAAAGTAADATTQDDNLSLAHWRFVVAQYTAPENASRNVKDYRVQLQQLLKEYSALARAAESLAECVLEQYHAEEALRVALDRLCEVEDSNRDPLKNEFVPAAAGGYLESLEHLRSQATGRAHRALQRSPQFVLTLQALVKYTISEIEAMLELLKSRDEFAAAADKARQALEKIKSDISKNGMNARRKQQLAALEAQCEERRAQAIFVDKGMLLYTIGRFQRERKEHTLLAVLQWAFVVRSGNDIEQDEAASVLHLAQLQHVKALREEGDGEGQSKQGAAAGQATNLAQSVAAVPIPAGAGADGSSDLIGLTVARLQAWFEQTPEFVPRELAQVALDRYADVEELRAAVASAAEAAEIGSPSAVAAESS